MRRTTMSLAGTLMLTACFGAPQIEPAAAPLAAPASADITDSGRGLRGTPSGRSGDQGGTPAGGTGADTTDTGGTEPDEPGDLPTDDDARGEPDAPTDEPDSIDPNDDPAANDDPAPSADPAKTSASSREGATRFLIDAAFGVAAEDVEAVQSLGYAGWMDAQMALPGTSIADRVRQLDDPHYSVQTDLFWEGAIEGEDQLRQRVAFALSEIVVISIGDTTVTAKAPSYAVYMDILREEAFGNYEDLIRRVSMTPAMGMYLSHLGNRPADPELGTAPDENFARELMQLFTIGLEELTPSGEPTGRPAYGQADVAGLAKVFTGFSWQNQDFRWAKPDAETVYAPMQGYAEYHDQSDKTFLGTTLPGGLSPEESATRALDHILAHPNVAPFVSKQLIQRLVTSNPTPDYVARVGAAYEAGRYEADGIAFGEGRRGDMAAVTAAILLDDEAREATDRPAQFGRVRPPLVRFAHFARTFRDDRGATKSGMPSDTGAMRYMVAYGQRAMGPPSVFGYTRPGYVAPGTWTGDQALVAPQMSLSSGASMVGYINTMGDFVRDKGERPRRAFFTPDYTDVLPMANDPAALVGELDLMLTARTMSGATKARIEEAVGLVVPKGESADLPGLDPETARRRVEVAVLMAVTAPAYGVQR